MASLTNGASFAAVELPDQASVDRHGIALDLATARVVLIAMSRLLAFSDAAERDQAYQMMKLVAPSAAVPVAGSGGSAPPLPLDPEDARVPRGQTAHAKLGIRGSDISRAWARSVEEPSRCLRLDWVLGFLPPAAWRHVAALIELGPEDASRRLNEGINVLIDKELPANIFRAAGSRVSAETILTYALPTWKFMRILNGLREEGLAREYPLLEPWTFVSETPTKSGLLKREASNHERDTSAPPIDAVIAALARWSARAGWGRYRPAEWPVGKRWRDLRKLTMLAILAGLSPRIETMHGLEVNDFELQHRFRDGTTGPGLRFRGEVMKMRKGSGLVIWRKLPIELADIIHAWILCSGRKLGADDEPLFTTSKTQPGTPGTRFSDKRKLARAIRGASSGGYQPLVPLDENPQYGYEPHRFRSFATQHVERRARRFFRDNPDHELADIDPQIFGELMTDHAVKDLGYRDYDTRAEQILALAIELHWSGIWGDGTKRRGLDPTRIIEARERVNVLRAEQSALEQQVVSAEAKKNALRQTKRDLLTRARKQNGRQRENALLDVQVMGDEIDDLNDEIATALRQSIALKDQLAEAVAQLEAARTTEVVLGDEWDDDVRYRASLDAALADDPQREHLVGPAVPLADELTTSDVARLFAVSDFTVSRWRKGTSTPKPVPFDREAWYAFDGSQKDWRLPVSAINLAAVPTLDPRLELDTIRAQRGALGFRRTRRAGTRTAA